MPLLFSQTEEWPAGSQLVSRDHTPGTGAPLLQSQARHGGLGPKAAALAEGRGDSRHPHSSRG